MNPELAFQPQLIIEDLSGKNLISCGRRREKKKRETLPWTINYIMKENSCPGNLMKIKTKRGWKRRRQIEIENRSGGTKRN